jgi:iron complex transport system substrate-binding protein
VLRAFVVFFLLLTVNAFAGRIVSLSPALTELLFYLGLEEEVVGVSDFCTRPECSKKERVGGIVNPNLEKIVSLKPTAVVATTMTPERACRSLESFGIECLRVRLVSLEDLQKAAERLAERFGAPEEKVKELQKEIEERAKELSCLKGKKVFIAVSEKPLYGAGEGSYLGELLEEAGAKVVLEGDFKPVSPEYLFAVKPQIVISFGSCEGFKGFRCVSVRDLKELLLHPGPSLIEGLRGLRREVCSR